MYEFKDSGKSYSLNATYLLGLFKYAIKQGKDAYLVVKFANGVRVECKITRE